MGGIQRGLPGVGKALLEGGENFVELFVVIGPVWRGAVGLTLPSVFQRGKPPQVWLFTSMR